MLFDIVKCLKCDPEKIRRLWFYFPKSAALPRVWYSISTMAYFEFWSTMHRNWENIRISGEEQRGTHSGNIRQCQGISGKISGKIPAEYQGNIREYEGKYQHPNWENISKREELTVEPAFAKMSGEPSIWTEGTAKKSGLKALKKKSGLRSDNIFNIFLNLIT